jgi:hypothetical protein
MYASAAVVLGGQTMAAAQNFVPVLRNCLLELFIILTPSGFWRGNENRIGWT